MLVLLYLITKKVMIWSNWGKKMSIYYNIATGSNFTIRKYLTCAKVLMSLNFNPNTMCHSSTRQ